MCWQQFIYLLVIVSPSHPSHPSHPYHPSLHLWLFKYLPLVWNSYILTACCVVAVLITLFLQQKYLNINIFYFVLRPSFPFPSPLLPSPPLSPPLPSPLPSPSRLPSLSPPSPLFTVIFFVLNLLKVVLQQKIYKTTSWRDYKLMLMTFDDVTADDDVWWRHCWWWRLMTSLLMTLMLRRNRRRRWWSIKKL